MKNFYDKTDYPWLQMLEDAVDVIREECLAVKDQFVTWPEENYHNGGWAVHGIYDYPFGQAELNHGCPFTADFIKQLLPNHGTAAFSVLKPGAEIFQHRGLVSAFSRVHLPLIVPEGDLGFEVRGEVRRWKVGKTFIFNDRLQHRAWNHTNESRYILLIDFKRGCQVA